MQKNIFLGVDIFLHILMHIQVIGGEIGYNRHIGAFPHGNKLKAGKLHYGAVRLLNRFYFRQKRLPDISSQMHLFPLGF